MVLPDSGTLSFQSIETEWLIGTAITKKLNGDLGPLIAISASGITNLGGSFYSKAYAREVTGITQGTTTSSSITLNWSGGGAGATSFSITSSPATTTQTASASGYNFIGLAASTAYTFTIVSKNAQGVAGQSATSGSFSTSSSSGLYSMTFPFTFTNMGATGRNGPSAITYSPNPGNGTAYALTLSGGIQYWTVPVTRSYTFTVAGAGVTNPGSGSTIKTGYGVVLTSVTYSLTAGDVIKILVGQSGTTFTGTQPGCGGAGGTFVYNNTTSTMLFIAGGAGGVGAQTTGAVNSNGSLTITGKNGSTGGTGGTGPNGGNGGNRGSGGAGSTGNGGQNTGGIVGTVPLSFTNGGTGGLYTSGGENAPVAGSTNGGFGGGGFGAGGAGGGGGGYGGGGGGNRSSIGASGGGGATYNINNPAGPNGSATNSGMGYVTVT